ncbi:hypothetical protein EVAR_85995_1 [Eumeta japonica]|uniref:Uncharacterized protein n=1 Tax=Eumeta variegata TaxID=151549 RepID=A0A4C1UJ41_EUMVA|nr:hypothetical protein EVAR_85995_1 [Eumeta japonica]
MEEGSPLPDMAHPAPSLSPLPDMAHPAPSLSPHTAKSVWTYERLHGACFVLDKQFIARPKYHKKAVSGADRECAGAGAHYS